MSSLIIFISLTSHTHSHILTVPHVLTRWAIICLHPELHTLTHKHTRRLLTVHCVRMAPCNSVSHTKRPFLVTFRRAWASSLCSSSSPAHLWQQERSWLQQRAHCRPTNHARGERGAYDAPLAPMSLCKVTGPATLRNSHPPCAGRLVKIPPARDHYQIKPTPPQLSAAGAPNNATDT